jgi:hypothetical protein
MFSVILYPLFFVSEFFVPETVYDVIISHAYCLHEGVTNGRADKFESLFNQIFTHCIRLRGAGGDIRHLFPRILYGSAMNELPDVVIKASKFLLNLQKCPGVRDSRIDFEPVSYDLRIGEQPGYGILRVVGDFPGIKIIKGFSVAFPLSQDSRPAQSRLRAFQNKKLEQRSVIMDFHPPFIIMIGLFEFASIGPVTTFHLSPSLDLSGFIFIQNIEFWVLSHYFCALFYS